jgi:hypothetical protein
VRVIEHALPQMPGSESMYRLLTTLRDEQQVPAPLLAALYHQRWEVELVFDELKTHLVQRRRVFRSKTPELVRQEFYGWMMARYAVRWLMYQGATQAGISERSLSFVANVQLLRRSLPPGGGHFPLRASKSGIGNCSTPRQNCYVKAVVAASSRAWSSAEILHSSPINDLDPLLRKLTSRRNQAPRFHLSEQY